MHYSSPSGPVDFNPLHNEGGDYEHLLEDRKADAISIHSTTRVETSVCTDLETEGYISIHSTTRVETWEAPALSLSRYTFQSTPPRGWRRFSQLRGFCTDDFNPLHHEGGDVSWQTVSKESQ